MTTPAPPRRLVYLGTPAVAVAPLRGLHGAGFDIALVITGVDRRRGRGSATSVSPVKAAALELGLPVGHDVDEVVDARADLGVVVAFGHLIRPHVLDRLDFVNVHYSLLPRWRGAAPIERAILAGDTETGVCIMGLESGLDAGPVYRRVTVAMSAVVTADQLREQLTDIAVPLLVDTLRAGLGEPEAQVGEPTYAAKLHRDDFVLDMNLPAAQLHRIVRIGGAHTTFRGKQLKVWSASVVLGHQAEPGSISGDIVGTADHGLRLLEVQPEGRPRMAAMAWLNGARPTPPERLGSP